MHAYVLKYGNYSGRLIFFHMRIKLRTVRTYNRFYQ